MAGIVHPITSDADGEPDGIGLPSMSYALAQFVATEAPANKIIWAGAIPPFTSPSSATSPHLQPHWIVWASQIRQSRIMGVGVIDALSEIEWEVAMRESYESDRIGINAIETNAQRLILNLSGKWFQAPANGMLIQGAMLRENRYSEMIDVGLPYARRLRFVSHVLGAMSTVSVQQPGG